MKESAKNAAAATMGAVADTATAVVTAPIKGGMAIGGAITSGSVYLYGVATGNENVKELASSDLKQHQTETVLGAIEAIPAAGRGKAFINVVAGGAKHEAKKADALSKKENDVQFHHPYPQYLGGKFQQLLEPLPRDLHAKYHSGLDATLPRQIPGGATAYYGSLSSAEKAQNLVKFQTYTKTFDRVHGTKLWDAAVREGVFK